MNMEVFEKADDWIKSNCWLACFDILGFKNLISVEEDDLNAFQIRVVLEQVIQHLRDNCDDDKPDTIDYCWFSDTILIFTADVSDQSCFFLQSIAKCFFEDQ